MESGALRTVISWVGGLPGCAGSPAVLGGGPTTPPNPTPGNPGHMLLAGLALCKSKTITIVHQGVSFQSSGAALVLLGTRATVGTGVAMEDPSPSPSSC